MDINEIEQIKIFIPITTQIKKARSQYEKYFNEIGSKMLLTT